MTTIKTDYAAIFAGCVRNEDASLNDLHQLHLKFRYMIYRQLSCPEAVNEVIQDTFLIVLGAIRQNRFRNPDGLMAFIRTVVKRQISTRIEQLIKHRQDVSTDDLDFLGHAASAPGPYQTAEQNQAWQLVHNALQQLNEEERQILVRFYLREETPEEICSKLNITPTQFRLNKSRALALFGEHGKSFMASGQFLNYSSAPKRKTVKRIAQLEPLAVAA